MRSKEISFNDYELNYLINLLAAILEKNYTEDFLSIYDKILIKRTKEILLNDYELNYLINILSKYFKTGDHEETMWVIYNKFIEVRDKNIFCNTN